MNGEEMPLLNGKGHGGDHADSHNVAVTVEDEPFNPFLYDSPVTCYEKIKIIVMCLMLVPLIRVAFCLIFVLPIIVLSFLGTLGHTPVNEKTGEEYPLSKWRVWIIYPCRWFWRAILFVVGFYWIPIRYPENFQDEKARIIVANHVTFIDGIFFLSHCFPSVAMRSDLAELPIICWIIRSLQPVLIDRTSTKGKKAALKSIYNRPNSGKFPPLLIFPEGTTSTNDSLTKFKRGAFTAGLPIQPVVLRYPNKHFDLSWPPTVAGAYLVGRMLCQVYNRLEVEYLPLYIPSEAEKQDSSLYAENVRLEMAQAMDVPFTNHAFEDVLLLLEVGEYVSDFVIPNTDVEEIKQLTSMSIDEIENLVRQFAAKDTNKDGQITYAQMKTIMNREDSEFLEHLFVLLDRDGNGLIDFRELCLGLSVISPNLNRDGMIRFAFCLYDGDGDGTISKDGLRDVLCLSRRMSGFPTEEVDQIVNDFDTDKHGRIRFAEFKKTVDKHPEILDKVFNKLMPIPTVAVCSGSRSPKVLRRSPLLGQAVDGLPRRKSGTADMLPRRKSGSAIR